jgi:uncharacterized protein YndB with AHSA1/START domain
VERAVELAAGPEAVWESLPSLLGDDVEVQAEPGGRIRARGPEGDRVGTVDEVDAPRRLAFWWTPVDGDDAPSFVELELTATAVGTLLRVRETRFDAAAVVDGLLRGPLARARA